MRQHDCRVAAGGGVDPPVSGRMEGLGECLQHLFLSRINGRSNGTLARNSEYSSCVGSKTLTISRIAPLPHSILTYTLIVSLYMYTTMTYVYVR